MHSIGVFCGSRLGNDAQYAAAAMALGHALAEADCRLVYGGGSVGLMGVLADAVLERGGKVTGIIPRFLAGDDVVHGHLDETLFVGDLFERKARMIEMSDGFIAMPGGLGTLDELLEVITWRQLDQKHGPIGLLDVDGFYAAFFAALRHFCDTGFVDAFEIERLCRDADADALLEAVLNGIPPA